MQLAPRHVAAVATFGILLLAAFVAPAMAGTQAAPEVTDAADDQTGPGGQKTCPNTNACQFRNADVLAAWVDNETADSFQVHIQVSGSAAFTASTQYTWNFRFKAGSTEYAATAVVAPGVPNPAGGPPVVGGTLTFSGVASNGSAGNGQITMTVLKSAIGATSGMQLGSLTADGTGTLAGQAAIVVATDRAPDGTAFGSNYTLQGGSGSPTAGDTDADGLNDTWEQQHFGGGSQNATGDPDGDDCNNACEFGSGTDPNNRDTDGDGYSDGEEIAAQTNPKDPNSRPGGPPTSSTSGPPTTGPTTSGGPTTTGPTTSTPPGSTEEKGEPMARLTEGFSNGAFGIGYLILACAIGGVVLLLAVIGRFGRWRL